MPRWAATAVIFVAMDGCNWFAHLANHRVRVLWRFHELHHSQEDMSVLTVFRTHPLIHVSYLIALIPGIVLLANGALSTTLLVIYAAILAFAHSNTNLGFGPLGRIFVSPNFHRIHHQLDGPQDVNLGFALTIWDQLFGRAVFPTEETIRTDTGLPGRPLIVEQAGPRPHHLSVFAAQLVAPFRPMNDVTDRPPIRAAAHRPEREANRVSPSAVPQVDVTVPGVAEERRGGLMVTAAQPTHRRRGRAWVAAVVSTRIAVLPADLALVAVRTALAWIFIWYGAGKLFGSFNGPGIHQTALFMANTAHLHPGGFFAVLGGVIEFGGGIAVALGLASRLAGLALFGDMVMAMITVTWANGINSEKLPAGYELNVALAVLALVVVLLGAGRFSGDALVERRLGAMGKGSA